MGSKHCVLYSIATGGMFFMSSMIFGGLKIEALVMGFIPVIYSVFLLESLLLFAFTFCKGRIRQFVELLAKILSVGIIVPATAYTCGDASALYNEGISVPSIIVLLIVTAATFGLFQALLYLEERLFIALDLID